MNAAKNEKPTFQKGARRPVEKPRCSRAGLFREALQGMFQYIARGLRDTLTQIFSSGATMQHCLLIHKDNIGDSLLYELWDRLCDSGTARTVFYDGLVNNHHAFRDFMRADGNQMFAVFYEGEPAGAVWVNDIRFANGRVHGFFFKELWGRKRDGGLPKSIIAGRYAMATLLREYAFDVLYGMIPCWNRVAIAFSKKCGAREVGIVPHGVWTTKGSVDAMMLATTKESTEEEWTSL